MYYIQESDKLNKLVKMCNLVKLQGNKIILPIEKDKPISKEIAGKLSKKTNKLLKNANSKKIILSNNIKQQELFTNYLNTYGFEIINGKWLFELLTGEIIEYIIKRKELNPQETQISFLVNQLNEITFENMKQSFKKYRRINIVTNHIEKFKNIEKEYWDEYGIAILVTNNKKKSLAKSNIIINIDFPDELINKYQIFEEAFIVNIQKNVKIKRKRFNGYCINDYEIEVGKEDFNYEDKNKYSIKDIYEAEIYKNQPYKELKKKLIKDRIKISKLIAINGEI